eukprot:TRINITY_DN1848_c0_g1_i1.p1 TRINITY_DN1848_c0_g1~~TRINITY_DN1848_c0_g1_i1.p1  ORF type:complete len:609 (+),score=259.78 TRINITY_DN1848_c0_g1_i1:71-1897(+)
MSAAIESLTGKLAVVSGKGSDLVADLVTTFKEHTAVLRPFIDLCSESLTACYPDLYGDDAEMKGKKFDLLQMLENGELEGEMEPGLMESVSTIGQLVDFFMHMKKNGKGIDDSDFSACTADQSGLLSAIAIASSASDSEFGVNAKKAIRASFYAGLAKDSSGVTQQWTDKGISLPNLRMPLLAGDDTKDLRELPDLTSRVADILSSKEKVPANWEKAYCDTKSKCLVRFGTDKHAKEVLTEAIAAAGGKAEDWQVEAAGSGGVMWDSIGITSRNEAKLIEALHKYPCGVSVAEGALAKYASPGDLLQEMQSVEASRQANRDPWQWADVNWVMVGLFSTMHVLAVWGIVESWNHPLFWSLWVQAVLLYAVTGCLGITAGAHRLWSHRSYKAHFPARLVMMVANSIANQGSIFHWSRDHRVHHAKSDTEADPHDITRGFFYSHMGWLLLKKRQAVKDAGKKIQCDDLLADPLVAIQHYGDPVWNQAFCFGLPTLYAWYVYDEALLGFLVLGAARWLICLHATWTVNSVAHTFGPRPYEPNMYPTESWFTTVVAVGEGYHNWHHTYPWDYSASEFGCFHCFNPTTAWIDALTLVGQAYGRRRATHTKPKFE